MRGGDVALETTETLPDQQRQMVLRVIAHADSPQIGTLGEGNLVLPGAVPGLIALMAAGVETLSMGDYVTPSDLHAVWRDAMTGVWTSVIRACGGPQDGPVPLAILAYSIFQAMTQFGAVERLLDAIHRRHALTALIVDAPSRTPEDVEIFGAGLGNPYYLEGAITWAQAKGIPVHIVAAPASSVLAPRARRLGWRDVARNVRDSAPVQVLKVLWTLVTRGPRTIIFTDLAPQLPPLPDSLGHQATIFRLAGTWPFICRGKTGDNVAADLFASSEWRDMVTTVEVFRGLLAQRVSERCRRIWRDGLNAFGYTRLINRLIRCFGGTPVLLTVAPFCDYTPKHGGFRAEAFRQDNNPVIEYQHGANYTLAHRGMTATLLTAGLGDLFLEWNSVGCREHESYGLVTRNLRYEDVGSPYRASCRKVPSTESGGRPRRILYAPTLISAGTVNGANSLWDGYLVFLDRMLTLLDQSGLWVDVTIIPNEEMTYYFSKRTFTNLRIHQLAFSRLARDSDVIIADSLMGSPPYEATLSDCPVIIYSGGPHLEFEPQFLSDLRERCILCETPDETLVAVRHAIGDLEGFINRSRERSHAGKMLEYFGTQSSETFWTSVLSHKRIIGNAVE